VNYLSNTGFTFRSTGLAVKVFADDDVGCQRAPVLWDLAVLLFKQNAAVFVLDVSGSRFPLDRVERIDAFRAEMSLDFHRAGLGNDCATVPILGFEIILEESLAAVHRALSLFKPHEINEPILSSFNPVLGLSCSASCRYPDRIPFHPLSLIGVTSEEPLTPGKIRNHRLGFPCMNVSSARKILAENSWVL
jgi:hypothetical protein